MIRKGSLCLIDGAGRTHLIGDGSRPTVAIRLSSRSVDYRLAWRPALTIGEAYMRGDLTITDGSLYEFLRLLARNLGGPSESFIIRLIAQIGMGLARRNPIGRSRRNVAHHYDLSERLYELFLDADRQYSCAYFEHSQDSLEQAQASKKRHIARKLLLDRPNLRVLDIGCGWGGLAIELARTGNAHVTGITLSAEQLKICRQRVKALNLEDRVEFHLIDYREMNGQFDRIVSVGMFEHVGKRNYGDFFSKLGGLLTDDGIALLHSIGYADEPGAINPFIQKYIFPGADLPALSEVFGVVEKRGLFVTDVEILRLHYAETLRHWRERFLAHREEAAAIYDERFCRMWEFYLVLCEIGFRHRTNIVFQMQLAKRIDVVPLTRSYMYEADPTVVSYPRAQSAPHRSGAIASE